MHYRLSVKEPLNKTLKNLESTIAEKALHRLILAGDLLPSSPFCEEFEYFRQTIPLATINPYESEPLPKFLGIPSIIVR